MAQTTKRALAASLKKLLKERPLDNITVKDIVEDCEVNRQTFYYHFQDIYDLLLWVFTTEARRSSPTTSTPEPGERAFSIPSAM